MPEKNNKLSVCIITFNEEKNIQACLASVRQLADEIVVVDNYSSDKTIDKFNRYTSIEAKMMYDQGVRVKPPKII